MNRQDILDRIDAINRDPSFHSNYGEASTAILIIESVPDSAIAEWNGQGGTLENHVFMTPGKQGSITLRWRRTSPSGNMLASELEFTTTGYGAADVTLDIPAENRNSPDPQIVWQDQTRPNHIFTGKDFQRTIDSLFAAYLPA